jgi:hypothetical protein
MRERTTNKTKEVKKKLLMSTGFIYGDLLSEDYYIVSYVSNSGWRYDGWN